ncbi:Gfo/Idh/MocA family protein [Baaleninema sp.]|uniref:Gfo/Idh/MocA family protein n=1 Tax=Baaleninema sp. TaxID=3101197 RepID=UPI003D04AA99
MSTDNPASTIAVGLVGTGFVANLRAETLTDDRRSQLKAVVGHSPQQTQEFARRHGAEHLETWQDLIDRSDIDVVFLCGINRDRGQIAGAAIDSGKHVVAEYPPCLHPTEAETLWERSRQRGTLLHIEHIELLSGLHQTFLQRLPQLEPVSYVRYATTNGKQPVSLNWTYHRELFGFPLVGALSRLNRLISAFGRVRRVSGQARFWDSEEPGYYTACLCKAQLEFCSGVLADVVYAKGDRFAHQARVLEVCGEGGTLILENGSGQLIRGDEVTPVEVPSRRGLFARDTQMVLDRLTENKPLYVTPEDSIYALTVADAVRRATETGESIDLV